MLTLDQPPEAMSALFHRARELGAQSLLVVPSLSSYPGPPPGNPVLSFEVFLNAFP